MHYEYCLRSGHSHISPCNYWCARTWTRFQVSYQNSFTSSGTILNNAGLTWVEGPKESTGVHQLWNTFYCYFSKKQNHKHESDRPLGPRISRARLPQVEIRLLRTTTGFAFWWWSTPGSIHTRIDCQLLFRRQLQSPIIDYTADYRIIDLLCLNRACNFTFCAFNKVNLPKI